MSKIQEIEKRWAAATPGSWSDHKATKQRNDPRLHEMFQASVRVGDVNAGNTIAIVYHGGPGATSSTADAVEANAHAIANAPSDVAYLLAEVKRLREALEQIRDHRPPLHQLSAEQVAEMEACKGCAEVRSRNWPPSRCCETHYRVLFDRDRRNENERNWQHGKMRDIAQEALRIESEAAQ